MSVRILEGDALTVLRTLPDRSVQCCVTSPPYFGLRDYGVSGQLGLEKTPQLYVDAMVGVFSEVKRVLRDDGTLWCNLGDSYASGTKGQNNNGEGGSTLTSGARPHVRAAYNDGRGRTARKISHGMKDKDLMGIPWMLAFALRADGWYLRSEIIWHKPSVMPESVTDRPTNAHEKIFLLTKSARYYYNADAIAEPCDPKQYEHNLRYAKEYEVHTNNAGSHQPGNVNNVGIHARAAKLTRNARSVWTIATRPYAEAHFATFPPELPERCISAGSMRRGWVMPLDETQCTVLDPFGGAGTTGLVADRLGRNALLIELNPKYAEMARNRIHSDNPLFGDVA